jgi:phospholipid transport system substrate-binding protein
MTRSALVLALLTAPVAVRAQAGDPAAARISAYDDAIIGIMKAGGSLSARADKFEPVVKNFYDMPAIAALVVGPGWASASAADRASAMEALTRHSAVSLAKNFKSYGGEKFTVAPQVVSRGPDKVVKVTIGGDTLLYRTRQSGGQWKIIDVVSGGVSQLTLQRADLQSTVAKGVPAMVQRLKQLDAVK